MSHLPNIKIHEHKEANLYTTKLLPFLEPLITRLATARPNWTFYAYKHNNTQVVATPDGEPVEPYTLVNGVVVKENGVTLGHIHAGNVYRKNKLVCVFTLSNRRILKARERGTQVETAKEETAYKTALKYFRLDSIQETLDYAEKRSWDITRNVCRDAEREYRDVRNNVLNNLDGFIETHTELISQHFLTDRTNGNELVEGLHMLPNLKAHQNKLTKLMKGSSGESDCYLVVNHDGKYIVRHLDNVQLYDDTTLPEHLKRNVGLLKLSESGMYMSGIGIKTEATIFVVEPEGD